MTSLFFTLPLEFGPGENWNYSNTGYYLLGKIVESLTGEGFFTYTQNNLTLRLGMNQTRACELAVLKGCMAQGYIQTKDGKVPARTLTGSYAFSAGGWAVTGRDMLNFLKAVNMKRLPSDSAGYDWRSNTQWKEHPFIYNGGRFFSTFHEKHIVFHNGGTPGFSSSWIHVEEDSISIIVLINQQDYAPVDGLAWDILSVYVPEIRYPGQAMQTPESIYWGAVLLQWMSSLQLNRAMPAICTQHLRMFLESPGGRGLWNWYFQRGYPTALYCVDVEITEEGKVFRYRFPVNERFEYRISAVINERDQLMRLRWW